MKQKDFDAKIYLIHSDLKQNLTQWLNSGHDWKTYPNSNHIDVVAGKFEDDHETCNGPLCLTCGYNPCWHCEPVPKPCQEVRVMLKKVKRWLFKSPIVQSPEIPLTNDQKMTKMGDEAIRKLDLLRDWQEGQNQLRAIKYENDWRKRNPIS